MNFISDAYARIVAWIGAAMIMKRRWNTVDGPRSFGLAPAIPKAVPQGIPTPLNFRSIAGWERALRVSGFVNVRSRRFRGMWPILRSYQQAVIVGDVASPAVTTSG